MPGHYYGTRPEPAARRPTPTLGCRNLISIVLEYVVRGPVRGQPPLVGCTRARRRRCRIHSGVPALGGGRTFARRFKTDRADRTALAHA